MIRALVDDDRAEAGALSERVLGRAKAGSLMSRWNWQYFANSLSEPGDPPCLAAEKDGKLAAMLFRYPVPMRVNGEVRRAFWLSDFVADPAAGGMGALLAHRMTSQPAAFLGIPNRGSRPIWEALGCRRILHPVHVVRLRAAGRVARLMAPTASPEWILEQVVEPPLDLDALGASPLQDRISIDRHAEWVRWRYLDRASVGYGLWVARQGSHTRAWIVERLVDEPSGKVGRILDFRVVAGHGAAARALLAKVLGSLDARGAIKVRCHFPAKSTSLRRILVQAGFWIPKRSDWMVGTSRDPMFPIQTLARGECWDLQSGDDELDIVR